MIISIRELYFGCFIYIFLGINPNQMSH